MTAEWKRADAGGFARNRRAFRRWRKRRPFWGGFFLMLSAFFLFWSGNLDFGNLSFHLGPSGYLSYLIPLVTLVCGVLTWVTPPQRMFYAVVGLATAIFSLIGLNFGGWVIGMVTGVVGAGLSFAWIPDKRKPVPAIDPTGDLDGDGDARAPEETDWRAPEGDGGATYGDAETTQIGAHDRTGRHGRD